MEKIMKKCAYKKQRIVYTKGCNKKQNKNGGINYVKV